MWLHRAAKTGCFWSVLVNHLQRTICKVKTDKQGKTQILLEERKTEIRGVGAREEKRWFCLVPVDTISVPLACHHLIGLLSVDRSDVAHIDWSSSVDVPVMWHPVIGHESRSLRMLSQPNSVRLINLFLKTNSLCSLISVCISAW